MRRHEPACSENRPLLFVLVTNRAEYSFESRPRGGARSKTDFHAVGRTKLDHDDSFRETAISTMNVSPALKL